MHVKSNSNRVDVENVHFHEDPKKASEEGENISKVYKKHGFQRPFSLAQILTWIYTAFQVLSYLFLSL